MALRTWVYDRGSAALTTRCRVKCAPVLHQLAAGSALRLPTRLDPAVCEEQFYAEFDEEAFREAVTTTTSRLGTKVRDEPRLFCRRLSDCSDARLRGFVTTWSRFDARRKNVVVTARAQAPGRIKLVLGGRTEFRRVKPGVVTMKIRRPARGSRLLVKTRLLPYYSAWATEDTKWVGGRP